MAHHCTRLSGWALGFGLALLQIQPLWAQRKPEPHPAVSIASPMGPDDPTDSFIAAEATALNHDPNQIYAFVRDQIQFEAYPGSLRGARGTLWAMAGNTLDKASLLAALLQASGYTTRYEHTTLSTSSAGNQARANLIYSMFPRITVLLGCIPPNTPTDDPAGNGNANSWSNDYYWVEYGTGNIDLDPNIAGGQPGQTVQAPDYNFSSVPTALQQQVTVKINAEVYNQASGLFGFGPASTTVLTQNFYTWQVVGNIISAGNIVQATATGSLDISAATFTYTPYLLVGSEGQDVSQDTVITGTDFQEYYTNFPLSSQIVTGIFVEVDANNDFGEQQTVYTHTLFDRIGPAVRQGNATAQITVPANPTPAVSDFDIATLNILPTRVNVSAAFQAAQNRLNFANQNYQAILPQFETLPTSGNLTVAQQEIAQQAANLAKYVIIAENELITLAYDSEADLLASETATLTDTRVYPSAPRVTIANSSMDSTGNARFSLDVLKNDLFAIDGLGNSRGNPYNGAVYDEEVTRGMLESNMEANILSQVTGATNALDIGTVMATLGDPNQLVALGPPPDNTVPSSATVLDSTTLSADAQTLILNAVQNGDEVITPNQMVAINGTPTVGWWETDANGHTVSHFPNGNHQAFLEYGSVNDFALAWNKPIVTFIGQIEGFALSGFAFAGAVLSAEAQNATLLGVAKSVKGAVGGVSSGGATGPLGDFFKDFNDTLKRIDDTLPQASEYGTSLLEVYANGLANGIMAAQILAKTAVPMDPDIVPFLNTPLGPQPAGVTPGTSPGVSVNVTVDPIFTYPFNGNELPVYDVNVVNTGSVADTFNLSPRDNSGQFRVSTSVPSLTLQPGQAGEVNMCVAPPDTTGVTAPAINSVSPLQVNVTGQASGATASATMNYTVPAIPSLAMSVSPAVLTVTPGGNVSANLIITSVGNASAGSVTLAAAADSGIAINGLTTPVTVPVSGAISEPVSFTAAANDAVGLYYVTVTASFTTAGGTQNALFAIPVTVQMLGTCTVNAALTARQTGATTLGNTLSALASDMNAAAGAPSNPAYVSRIAGDLSVINFSLSNISYLQSFTGSITGAGNAVASATPGTLLTALSNLDTAICAVGSTLSQASSYNTQIYLTPNTLVTGPNLPATYTVILSNPSNTTKVYNLSASGVPSGVTVQFNSASVTLGPNGQYTDYSNSYGLTPITLTLTPGASFTTPFTFNVVATPVGAPEFAISAPGSLQVRPQQISIDSVSASPAYGPAGTQFIVTARVFAEVNENVQAYLTMNVLNAGGQQLGGTYQSQSFTLSTTSTIQTVTIGTIDSTSFANGSYTLSVQGVNAGNQSAIQGATASGAIVVGAILSGTLTANAGATPPGSIPPGNSTVQVALNITRDTVQNPISTLVGSVQLQGISRSMTLYQNGSQQLAYACSDSYVNIVDVTNPASPLLLGTFANNLLTSDDGNPVSGFQAVACAIYQNTLLLSYTRGNESTTSATIPTHFAVFSLANPLTPVEIGSEVDIARGDSQGLYVTGNTALMYQSTINFNSITNVTIGFSGDIWTADLTSVPANGTFSYLNDVFSCGGINPNTNACNNATQVPAATNVNGVCTPSGTTPVANTPSGGGPYYMGAGTAVNSTTSYFASSTANGVDAENPNCPAVSGQLLVVDTTTPSSPHLLTSVPAPAMAFMTGVAVQGNTAVGVGDSLGVFYASKGYLGTLVISSFDISNPTSPVLLDSITTQLADNAGSFIVPLGQNTFAVGNTTLNGTGQLVLVDASTPGALRYIPYNALLVANPTIAQNGYFFALSSTPASTTNALSAFQLTEVSGPQINVSLNLPTSGEAVIDPASFNPAPTSVTTGTASNTYVWNQPTVNTIAFNMKVSGANPGDVPMVVLGGQMNYTLPSTGAGTFVLPPLTALCQQILSISPAAQSVQNAGGSATYAVTIDNPTGTTQTFVPSTLGLPASWGVSEPASLTVAPGSSQTYNLVVTTPLNAAAQTYSFFAFVSTAGGITASAGAAVSVNFVPNSSSGNENSSFVTYTASLNPTTVTIGQNGMATFQLAITNTGNAGGTISVLNGSPTFAGNSQFNGWQINFTPNQNPVVLPGLKNTVTLTGTLSLPNANFNSTAPGAYPIQIQLQNNGNYLNLPLTVVISGAGVTAALNPGSGTPASNYSLTLQNVGTFTDSYALSIQGTLAQSAGIQSTAGPVNAGRSVQVPILLNPVDFASPGSYTLQVKAVSQANPAIVAYATANVAIAGSKGVSAAITPSRTSVQTTPGTVSLLLQATNTGNIPDSYTASITSTSGPVQATLNGAQSVASFPIPALGNSAFPLNAEITGPGAASITVTVTSLTNSAIASQATVNIDNTTPGPPTASALPTQANTPLHRLALLNAGGSSDPNSLPLSFLWTVSSVPLGSAVTSASISLPASALAAFRPDVAGTYLFNVNVSNGTASANATASYTAVDAIPVAVTGGNFNAGTGVFAFLDGRNSYDPDGQPIAFAWTLVSAPNSSAVTSGSIYNSQTPNAFFTPDVAGAYQFQLIVSDTTAASLPALVTVTASSGTIPPHAIAGPAQNTGLHTTVTVTGAKSFDPNPSPQPLNYQWTLTTVPNGSGAALNNPTGSDAQFTTDLPGTYVASLVVSNSDGTSQAAATTVTAYTGDIPPNANAGASQFVRPNTTVTLNSQASADPDNGPLPLAFLWWLDGLPAGSAATLQQPDSSSPTFVADQSGYYIGRVEANDGLLAGFANSVVISAAACDADANGTINQTDVAIIQQSIGQTVKPNDPRDYYGTGTITQQDVTACTNLINTSPSLQISPASFSETLPQGSARVSQPIMVSSSGNPIGFTVSSNQSWLTASVASGSTASLSSVTAYVTPGSLTPNTYTGALTFTPSVGSAQTVSVTLTVTTAAFTVSPSSFTVNLVQNGPQYSQPIQITNTGAPVSFTVGSNQSWLTSSITSGNTATASAFYAQVSDGGLSIAGGSGSFSGTLTVTPAGGTAQSIAVTLTITAPGPVSASPGTLSFSATYGGAAPAAQQVNVTSTSGATNFTVTSDSPWITTVSTGTTPQEVSVTANPGGMVAGTYTGNLTFTSGSNTAKVTVTFTIAEAGGISACDVNSDGTINLLDVQKMINQALGNLTAANDLNHDGIVNVVDIQIDANAALNLGCAAH